ncbi:MULTISPECIES: hypothetical protein [unclassified Microbacterium]|uniref:hypothetical protein n=2 Tax=unclassified Microbacterium TaxID=2609290 RepID=UPI000DAFDD95|nr:MULTISPECIES: hypothetical protein [unclassified Microbacterium]PZT86208.1 MAG: hypothetical protein DI630_35305 [Gordonia sp. (in: high G+C Gram-positive bacteria)]
MMTMFVGAIVIAGTLVLSGCGASFPDAPDSADASFPDAPDSVGEEYPTSGVPVSVAWPSDWLEGFFGEANSPPGPLVGLRLEYVDDQWVWRVRSLDPGRDEWGESVTEPDRGQEALYDASTLAVKQKRHVTLTEAELADLGVSAYAAAQLSGEVYPSPRLIELALIMQDGRPAWRITTYDTETGLQSEVTVDAN